MVKRGSHPALWVIVFLLGVIAGGMVLRPGDGLSPAAMAQATASGGSRGIFAFSGQLAKDVHGVFLVDVDAMTIWAYEYMPAKPCLRLAAARTWRYDRYLKNYNNCGPSPYDIEQLVDTERKNELQMSRQQMP